MKSDFCYMAVFSQVVSGYYWVFGITTNPINFISVKEKGEPLRNATLRAIEIARSANKIISFDPNLRPFLWEKLRFPRPEMTKDESTEIIRFAHACGALTVSRKGVIPALPSAEEVAAFIKKRDEGSFRDTILNCRF